MSFSYDRVRPADGFELPARLPRNRRHSGAYTGLRQHGERWTGIQPIRLLTLQSSARRSRTFPLQKVRRVAYSQPASAAAARTRLASAALRSALIRRSTATVDDDERVLGRAVR